jgi:putative heme-binding domain-containing protein
LRSANGWERDTAQRLLIERGDASVGLSLRSVLGSRDAQPLARLHALYTLSGLGELTFEDIVAAWNDPHPGVREHGVKLSEAFPDAIEQRLTQGGWPEFDRLMNDPDLRVHYQLALTLGELGPRAAQGLLELALRNRDVMAIQTAVLSSAPKHVDSLLRELFRAHNKPPPAALARELVKLATARGKDTLLGECFASIPRSDFKAEWAFAVVAGFFDALDQRKLSPQDFRGAISATEVHAILAAAREVAALESAADNVRLGAIRLLGRVPASLDADFAALAGLLEPHASPELQREAVRQLARSNRSEAANVLLDHWETASPARRTDIINELFARSEWLPMLIARLETDRLSPNELGTTYQQKLLSEVEGTLRVRVEKLFGAKRTDRTALIKEYAQAALIEGDAARGADLFRQQCALCHRFKGEGVDLGPDLQSVAAKTPDALIVAILDPNAAIESRYINYLASTKNGRTISGVITAENANSITLRLAGGTEESVLRADLESLKSTGLSMMPEGLETAIAPASMADLLAYIRGN